jgi:hypothetical protein
MKQFSLLDYLAFAGFLLIVLIATVIYAAVSATP